jgi:hypothetical protein
MLANTSNKLVLPKSNDIDRYYLVWEINRELNGVLGEQIPSSGQKECTKDLDFWKHGRIDGRRDGEVNVFLIIAFINSEIIMSV